MSYRPEMMVSPGEWSKNALRFATKAEAEAYALDLSMRWTSVRDTRAVECSDPVNYVWNGKLEPIAPVS